MTKPILLTATVLALCVSSFAFGAEPNGRLPASLEEAIDWLSTPTRVKAHYEYVMTGKLRLLLFWVGKDDVGGGYVRLEERMGDPRVEAIRLKIGSDPDKAPRGINRWGAATEMVRTDLHETPPARTSAFFGFMKGSRNETRESAEDELIGEEETKRYRFEASLSRVDRGHALSSTFPFHSAHDFNIHQSVEAERMVLSQYQQTQDTSKVKELKGEGWPCERTVSFLFTVKEMTEAALSGQSAPSSLCYVYNARPYLLTLTDVKRHDEKTVGYELKDSDGKVEATYRDVFELRYRAQNLTSGKSNTFELWIGNAEPFRGVPLQIVYQPNWWFKVILSLRDEQALTAQGGAAGERATLSELGLGRVASIP